MPQRHIPFRTTATAAVLAVGLALAGCGSSHHDSTGPREGLGLTPGIYRGTANLTASAGGQSGSQSGPVVLTLNPDSTVQVGQFPPVKLQGNSFTASLPYTFFNQNPQLHCTTGTFNLGGTFVGQTVSGPIFSNGLVCNGFTVTFTGNYTAQLSASELPQGGGRDDVADQARRLLERLIH